MIILYKLPESMRRHSFSISIFSKTMRRRDIALSTTFMYSQMELWFRTVCPAVSNALDVHSYCHGDKKNLLCMQFIFVCDLFATLQQSDCA